MTDPTQTPWTDYQFELIGNRLAELSETAEEAIAFRKLIAMARAAPGLSREVAEKRLTDEVLMAFCDNTPPYDTERAAILHALFPEKG